MDVHDLAPCQAQHQVAGQLQHGRVVGGGAVDDGEVHELQALRLGSAGEEGGRQAVDQLDGVKDVRPQLVARAPFELAHALVLVPASGTKWCGYSSVAIVVPKAVIDGVGMLGEAIITYSC